MLRSKLSLCHREQGTACCHPAYPRQMSDATSASQDLVFFLCGAVTRATLAVKLTACYIIHHRSPPLRVTSRECQVPNPSVHPRSKFQTFDTARVDTVESDILARDGGFHAWR